MEKAAQTGAPVPPEAGPGRSCLYQGAVVHRRDGAVRHRLRYRVFWLLTDLTDLPALRRRGRWKGLPLLGVDGPGLLSFRQADHGDGRRDGLLDWVRQRLTEQGLAAAGEGPVLLLAMPRVLGGVFNPLSVYFCHRADGGLGAVIYQVNNTFGDRHSYVVPVSGEEEAQGVVRSWADKTFHVSPFLPLQGGYRFRTRPPSAQVSVGIRLEGTEHDLSAALTGSAVAVTPGACLRLWLRHPLLWLAVLGGIHWEALRLWRKGAPFFRRTPPPGRQASPGQSIG